MIRVLVCGGRELQDQAMVDAALDGLDKLATIFMVIEGGADGADTLARRWAKRNGVARLSMRAKWREFGRSAGPIRNREMLETGRPDLVLAFPGGAGTADMVRQALKAGVEVLEVRSAQTAQSGYSFRYPIATRA